MKKYKDLFEKICTFKNLYSAYSKARKCKRYRDEILRFSWNLEKNLLKLQEELLNQNYKHGCYREFIVCDSNAEFGKSWKLRNTLFKKLKICIKK